MENENVFAKRLRFLMESRNVTQTELAKCVGVTRQTISKYELGLSTALEWKNLAKIAKYFRVSTDYLVGLTSEIRDRKHWISVEDISEGLGLSLKTVKDLISVKNGWKKPTKVTEIILMADAINRQEAPK